MKRTVLVVSRQSGLRAKIAQLLQPLAFAVEVAADDKRVREIVARERLDAAIVAVDLLDGSDLGLARELARSLPKLIVLAHNPGEMKRLAALVPEAHIVRDRPLDHKQLVGLLADTRAAADNSAGDSTEILHFEGRALDLRGRTLQELDGGEVPLTHAEFDLLATLIRQRGRVLSRDQLRDALGGRKADPFDRSIDMLVARLRRKIEPQLGKPRFIVTVPGAGYKFTARTTRSELLPEPIEPRRADPAKAERRQLTVLACQVMGLSAASARLDPEDLHSITRAVHEACRKIVVRRGGMICRALADEVLVCFGYPEAHEDDAQRAMHTALDLTRALDGMTPSLPIALDIRIGVATGLALVGGLGEPGVSAGGTLVGEPLDVALGLRSRAGGGRVVVASSTHRLAGRFFEYRALHARGGGRERAWEAVGIAATVDRSEALRPARLAPLIGRSEELGRLARLWGKARLGSGQAVLLSGDAGIGKSRLAAELLRRIARDRPAVIRYSATPHQVDSPMAPLVCELCQACAFAPDDTPGQRLAKLERLLIDVPVPAGTALLAELAGLPTAEQANIAQLAPQKRKDLTLAALLSRIESLAAHRPVCIVVEDAHWMDATSLEFIDLLVERLPSLRLMMVMATRPEFRPAWMDQPQATSIVLTRLARDDSALLTRHVAAMRTLTAHVIDEIVGRADGVPLFLEELTSTVLEAAEGAGSGVAPPDGANSLRPSIPQTLRASLLARLDRLGPARELAQVGAAIGREFTYELLRLLAPDTEAELRANLDHLVASGLVRRRGVPPLASYEFKHALVRDAAYDVLSRPTRRQMHGRIAAVLEERFAATIGAEAGLLAHHWREAGDFGKAVAHLLVASERALLRAATTEAVAQLTQALRLLSTLPEGKERWNQELKLQITLGRALIASRGYAAPETRQAYHRASELCDLLDDQAWRPLILFGHWSAAWNAGDQETALLQAEQLLRWGTGQENAGARAIAHFALGLSRMTKGIFVTARDHFESALAINRFVVPGLQPFLASDADGRLATLGYLHNCLLVLGWPERAESVARQVVAELPTQLYSLARTQVSLCRMHFLARDAAAVADVSSHLSKLAESQGYPFFAAMGQVYGGWALAQTAAPAKGIDLCRAGIVRLRAIGSTGTLPGHLTVLAECHALADDPAAGLQAISDAFANMEQTDCRAWEAETHRIKGKLLHLARRYEGAEESFRHAMDVARSQDTRLLELRAAVELARLLAARQRQVDARRVLAPVYQSLTEGHRTIDLEEAKDLLDQLHDRQRLQVASG